MKRKILLTVIAVGTLTIGSIGAANSFFVNEELYFMSIALIIMSLLMFISICFRYIFSAYKKASVKGKWMLCVSVLIALIITFYAAEKIM